MRYETKTSHELQHEIAYYRTLIRRGVQGDRLRRAERAIAAREAVLPKVREREADVAKRREAEMGKGMFGVIVVAILLGSAQAASAQAISSYTFKVYNQGASSPVQTATLQAANVSCNQTATANPGQVANPTKAAWDDPVGGSGKQCVWTDTGTGVLVSLPFGTQVYESTIAATNSVGTSPESARSNLFTRPGAAPAVRTGVLVLP